MLLPSTTFVYGTLQPIYDQVNRQTAGDLRNIVQLLLVVAVAYSGSDGVTAPFV